MSEQVKTAPAAAAAADQATPPDASDKATASDIISYGLGGAACTMPAQFKTQFSMPFMSDVAGLNVGVVGFWISLMTIWDAINDPIIGGIADRTNTRWGKYRPHMMIGSLLWGIVTVLLFSSPNLTGNAQMAFYVVMLAVWSVFYTQFTVPWQALNSVMSSDPHQRNLLLTSRQLAGFISGSLVGIITLPIVERVGQTSGEKTGYLVAAIVVGLVTIITGQLSAWGVRRKDYQGSIPTPTKQGFSGQMNILFKNRAVICAAILLGLVTLVNALNAAITVYYLKYVVGNTLVLSYTALITLVCSLGIIPAMPFLLRKLGKPRTLLIGMIIVALGSLPLFFLRENATSMQVVIMSFVASAGFTLGNVTCMSMVPDCTDYTELHFGTNQAGFINAIITFFKKMCQSLSTLVVGGLLAMVGYSAATADGDMRVMRMILDIKCYYPIILLILTIIVLKIYPITTQYGVEMRAQLKEIRAQKAAEQQS